MRLGSADGDLLQTSMMMSKQSKARTRKRKDSAALQHGAKLSSGLTKAAKRWNGVLNSAAAGLDFAAAMGSSEGG